MFDFMLDPGESLLEWACYIPSKSTSPLQKMRTVEEEDVANYATTNEGGGKRGKCQIVLPQRPTSDN